MTEIELLTQKVKKTNSKEAYAELGDAYCRSRDLTNAISCYKKAAELGSAYGMQRLGWMYYKGWGVEKSNKLAKQYLRSAADAGSVQALVDLGWMCYNEDYGFMAAKGKAFEFWMKASKLGNAEAQIYVANSYLTDTWGEEQSVRKAAFWFACAYNNMKATQKQKAGAKDKLIKLEAYVNVQRIEADVINNHPRYLNL